MDWMGGRERCNPSVVKRYSKVGVTIFASTCAFLILVIFLYDYNSSMVQFQKNMIEIKNQLNDMQDKVEKVIMSEKSGTELEMSTTKDSEKEKALCQEFLSEISEPGAEAKANATNAEEIQKKKQKCAKFGNMFGLFSRKNRENSKEIKPEKKSKNHILNDTIKAIVCEALQMYSADKTGKTDYALESAGGSIVSIRDTTNYNDEMLSFLGVSLCENANGPRQIIQASVNPGECWSFRGSKGTAIIKLVGVVFVTGITVEHIPKDISPTGDISSAPREMSIWGLNDPEDANCARLGVITYDNRGPPVQYFDLEKLQRPFQFVEVRIHSNYGNEAYTCVYRVRIHGTLEKLDGVKRV